MERAAGYAVPLLQSGLEIDPMESLLLGTALTRAGATNTKSGTWLREMAIRAMPGTSMMSRMASKKHEAALKRMGLVDDEGKPTWFDDKGKPDLEKMLSIAGPNAANIPVAERAGIERQLFGAQGGGAFALLADPAVNAQVKALRATMDSPEFKNRYAGFTEQYMQGSTAQMARTAMADFNVTMMDLGANVLPSVNNALHNFKGLLEGIRSIIPGGDKGSGVVGGHPIQGGIGGAVVGSVIPGVGTIAGAGIGGLLGGAEGWMEQYDQKLREDQKRHGGTLNDFLNRITGRGEPPKVVFPPITMNLNVDGDRLAQTVVEHMQNSTERATSSPNYNALSNFGRADGGLTTE